MSCSCIGIHIVDYHSSRSYRNIIIAEVVVVVVGIIVAVFLVAVGVVAEPIILVPFHYLLAR